MVAGSSAFAQPNQPLPEADKPTIGYPSVAAALAALKARPDVTFSTQGGWTIATEASSATLWSFPPAGHPAYPSAVKRQIENRSDGAYVNMSVQCEASKSACDDLVRSFQQLNKQMAEYLKSH
jgi:hypothetical protein